VGCLNENLNQKCEIASLPLCPFLPQGKRETTLPSINPEGSTSTNQLLQDKKLEKFKKYLRVIVHSILPPRPSSESFFLREKKDNHWEKYKNKVLQACHTIDWCQSTCGTRCRCFVRETYPT
jgi:hypothetical protein